MTRKLLFAATVAMAISSCTQVEVDEVATQSREPIRFEQFVGKATRGEDVTTQNLTQFRVLGKKFNSPKGNIDITVTKGEDNSWTYPEDQILYWEPGATYCFAAIYAGESENKFLFEGNSAENYSITCSDFTDAMSEDKSTDIVAAICTPAMVAKESGNEAVQFDFDHILAKVQITIINGEDDGARTFPVQLKNIETASSFTLSNTAPQPTWQNKGTTYTYNFSNITLAASGSKTITLYLIPQDGISQDDTTLKPQLYIDRRTSVGDEITCNLFNDVVTKWEAGKVYNYKITIKQEEMKYSTKVEEWAGSDDVDLNDK